MKKSMLKSLLFAMIGLFTFSQVQAEERVVATVNGTPILQSQVNACLLYTSPSPRDRDQ